MSQNKIITVGAKAPNRYEHQDAGNRKLRLSTWVWAKLLHWRDKGSTEVTGFMITAEDDPLCVEDIVLIEAECSAAFVDMSEEDIMRHIMDYFDAGIVDQSRITSIWWHTHPGSSAGPSGQDEETFDDRSESSDWNIMFILARGGQMTCRLRLRRAGLSFDIELPVYLDYSIPWPTDVEGNPQAQWDEAFDEKVKRKTYTVATPAPLSHYNGKRNDAKRPVSQTLGWDWDSDDDWFDADVDTAAWLRDDTPPVWPSLYGLDPTDPEELAIALEDLSRSDFLDEWTSAIIVYEHDLEEDTDGRAPLWLFQLAQAIYDEVYLGDKVLTMERAITATEQPSMDRLVDLYSEYGDYIRQAMAAQTTDLKP